MSESMTTTDGHKIELFDNGTIAIINDDGKINTLSPESAKEMMKFLSAAYDFLEE